MKTIEKLWKVHKKILNKEDSLSNDNLDGKAKLHKIRLKIRIRISQVTSKLYENISKIENADELQEIYAQVFNLENTIDEDNLILQFECFKVKSTITSRIDFILSNKGMLGHS